MRPYSAVLRGGEHVSFHSPLQCFDGTSLPDMGLHMSCPARNNRPFSPLPLFFSPPLSALFAPVHYSKNTAAMTHCVMAAVFCVTMVYKGIG